MKTGLSLILASLMLFLGLNVVEAGSSSPLVFGVKWSENGRWIAAHTNQGMWLFDTSNPEAEAQVFLEGEVISDIEFDPSSNYIAAASNSYETDESSIKVVSLVTGEVTQELHPEFSSEDYSSVIYDVDFSANGEMLIVANTSLLTFYDFASGDEITVNREMTFSGDYGSSHWITSIDEFSEGGIFAVTNWNGDVFVVDAEDGVQARFNLENSEYNFYAIEVLGENHFLIHSGNAIMDWDVELEPTPLIEASEDSFITGFAYHPEAEHFLYGTNGLIGLFDIEAGETVLEISLDESLRPFSFDFSPRGSQFVSLQTDGSIIVWDTETGEEVYRLGSFENAVSYKWG